MIIAINAIGTRHSGAAQVLIDLLQVIVNNKKLEKIIVFISPDRMFTCFKDEKIIYVEGPWVANNRYTRYIWLFTGGLSNCLKDYRCDLVINLNNFAGKINKPQVLFIQQALYFSLEALNTYRNSDLGFLTKLRMYLEPFLIKKILRLSINLSQKVIVQTNTMKKLTVESLKVNDDKIDVIYPMIPTFGVDDYKKNNNAKPSNNRLVTNWLYVGSIQPYKNTKLIQQVADITLKLGLQWKFHMVTPSSADSVPWEHSLVIWHDYMSRDELQETYKESTGLIMPSFIETVGLPMIEAMLFNIPVIAADRNYAHEICGGGAFYFDPNDPQSLFDALCEICSNDMARNHLIFNQKKLLKKYIPKIYAESWIQAINALL